jgi:integrase
VYWDGCTAHLLPASRRQHPQPAVPVRTTPRPGPPPTPHTGRSRLGYDRDRILLVQYADLNLHQLRHSAATHLGEAEVPLQLIMGKTRHKDARPVKRYVKPRRRSHRKVTEILAPPPPYRSTGARSGQHVLSRLSVNSCEYGPASRYGGRRALNTERSLV